MRRRVEERGRRGRILIPPFAASGYHAHRKTTVSFRVEKQSENTMMFLSQGPRCWRLTPPWWCLTAGMMVSRVRMGSLNAVRCSWLIQVIGSYVRPQRRPTPLAPSRAPGIFAALMLRDPVWSREKNEWIGEYCYPPYMACCDGQGSCSLHKRSPVTAL